MIFCSIFCPNHRYAGPGGRIVIRDADIIVYSREHPPPPEGQEPDTAAYMQGTSTVANVNRIVVEGALQRGFVVGYALLLLGNYYLLTE